MPPKSLSRDDILWAIRLHHFLSVLSGYHFSKPQYSFLEGDAEAGAYWTGGPGKESSSFRWDVQGLVGVGFNTFAPTSREDDGGKRPLRYLTGLPPDLEPLARAAAAALQNRVVAGCWIGRDGCGYVAQKHNWNGILSPNYGIAYLLDLDEAHDTVAKDVLRAAGFGHVTVTEAQAQDLLRTPQGARTRNYEWPSPNAVYYLRRELRRRNIHWPPARGAEPWTTAPPRRAVHGVFRRFALLRLLERHARDPLFCDPSFGNGLLEGDDREGLFYSPNLRARWCDAGVVAVELGQGIPLDTLPSDLRPLADALGELEVDFFITEDGVVKAPELDVHATYLFEGGPVPLDAYDLPEALILLTARLAALVEHFVQGEPLVPIPPALADELLATLPQPPSTREAARSLQWALTRVGLSWAIPAGVYPVPAEPPPAPFPEVDDLDEVPPSPPATTFESDPLAPPALASPPPFTVDDGQDAVHVYGDWLEQQGHPLGRWVALHHALALEHSDEVVHSLMEMSEQYGEHLLPKLDETPEWPAYVLRGGLIHAARIMPPDQRTPLAARLRRLLRHPASLLMRGLVIGHRLSQDILGLNAAIEVLAEAPSHLDALYLVQSLDPYPNNALVGGRLWAARPRLRKLILALTDCALGPIDAPQLEHLGLRVSLEEAAIDDFTAAPLPALTTLDLDLTSRFPFSLLLKLVAPRLRELRVGMAGRPVLPHELDALCAWPGFQSLRILQLTNPSANDGSFDDGVFLHAYRERLSHLEEVRLVPMRFGAFSSVEGVHPFRILHPSRSVREGDPLLSLC